MHVRTVAAALLFSLSPGCDTGPTTPPQDAVGDEAIGPADPIEAAAQKIAQGDAQGALTLLEDALDEHPDDHELLFSKGVALRELGRVDDAMAAWDAALSKEPDFFGALHAKGAVYLEAEDWPRAIETLQAAAVAKPDYAAAHYNLALALLGQGGPDAPAKAQQALRTAVSLDAKDVDAALLLADLYIKENRLDEAAPLLDAALEHAPEDPRLHAAGGRAALKAGDGEAALAAFERALAAAPQDAGYQLGQAQALLRLGRAADAETKLAALSERAADSAVVWLEWGTALAKQGKLEPALAKMDEAVRRGPQLISAQVRRIGVLSDLGRCKDAKAALGTLREATDAPGAIEAAGGAVARCRRGRARPGA